MNKRKVCLKKKKEAFLMRLKLTYFNFLLKASGQLLQKSKKLILQSLEEKKKKGQSVIWCEYIVNNYKLKMQAKTTG